MAYEKTVWKNREVERPRTFEKIENPDGTITLVPAEGNVIEEGTPIIAENMNKIEQGIQDAHDELDKHKADSFQHISYVIATGTNSYVANIQGITALTEGMSIKVRFQNANTGTATLNINGLGAKEIRKSNGNALTSGNIKSGQICHLVYTGSVFQLLGEGGEYGNVTPDDVIKGVTFGTEEGLKTGTLELIGDAAVGDVLSGKTFYNTDPKSKQTGTMPDRRNYQGSEQSSSNIVSLTQHETIPSTAVIKVSPTFAGFMDNTTVIQQNILNLNPSTIKTGVKVGSPTKYITGTYTGEGNATTSEVLSGRTFSTATLSNATGTMPNRGAVTGTITTQGGSYTIPAGYHNGSGKVTANFANLVASNIKKGVNIGGVVGTLKEIKIDTGTTYTTQTPAYVYTTSGMYKDTGTTITVTKNFGFTPDYIIIYSINDSAITIFNREGIKYQTWSGIEELQQVMYTNISGNIYFAILKHIGGQYNNVNVTSTGFTLPVNQAYNRIWIAIGSN